MPDSTDITAQSLQLFLSFARDAPNWSGEPLVCGLGAEGRGNLTQLKRAGLLRTFDYDGDTFVQFTPAGIELAAQHGITLRDTR
ncbi:hypothetical protein [Amycolatopsis eburnea]|uniref:ArsR family transcriptional regulator n=1 Tax=Amycolatopsis eburnea TaxID=2267691 RepID=A0A427TPU8_9PSEU|nr:hypothetical protein [Amycolatopsis eburnea]RSD26338.1 hypothetical protein EIY87_00295 [Amycolatopsis eburnea]